MNLVPLPACSALAGGVTVIDRLHPGFNFGVRYAIRTFHLPLKTRYKVSITVLPSHALTLICCWKINRLELKQLDKRYGETEVKEADDGGFDEKPSTPHMFCRSVTASDINHMVDSLFYHLFLPFLKSPSSKDCSLHSPPLSSPDIQCLFIYSWKPDSF
ncbi:unnamed protein product [Lactuca saligna]|uniref:Uncharacterized protein n=1 Tax=Lactuca saligna TaxID=75948 RepID=A0AA35ZWU5_LACSI|nr:unnamed protein product [Lactuca saligna]